jgi:fructose-1,6-bisphosphatase/inositol monophosphatase family enzyme
MLAAGLIDLCLEPSLQPYDITPIIPIVEKSGGVVTCLDGSRAENGGAVLVSATPALHEHALRILNNPPLRTVNDLQVRDDTSPR